MPQSIDKQRIANFITLLTDEFEKHANPQNAIKQKAYLRNQFEFYGIKAPIRNDIQKLFFKKDNLPTKNEANQIIRTLWTKDKREYQYFAQELAHKYAKQFDEKSMTLFEEMATHKSWWDTVDVIAPKLMGEFLRKSPEKREKYSEKWIKSENIWLQRSAILFQLRYKTETDTELLAKTILTLRESDEFFIRKAIGWALREYGKTNAEWVINFVKKNKLSPLSQREAMRIINNKK